MILGKVNLDPVDGEGRMGALHALLADPRIQDPAPQSAGGLAAEGAAAHRGDPRLDTAEFGGNAGNLRVDYVLPSADLTVIGSGVFWPDAGDPMAATVALASTHRLVYVDLRPALIHCRVCLREQAALDPARAIVYAACNPFFYWSRPWQTRPFLSSPATALAPK